jgi:hypothetical protein
MNNEFTPLPQALTDIPMNAMAGETAINSQNDQELQKQGSQLLGESLTKLVESDEPGAVKDYLEVVLTDTEGNVPAAERAVVFGLLAHEQRDGLKMGLLGSGEQMLDSLASNDTRSKDEMRGAAESVSRAVSTTAETHEQAVGRHMRAGGNARAAANGNQEVGAVVQKSIGSLSQFIEKFGNWGSTQSAKLESFDGSIKNANAHERALDEASKVVQPDYEGDAKNISAVIDEKVKTETANKLTALLADARNKGISPETAVFDLLTKEPDTLSGAKINELRTFVSQYRELLKTSGGKLGVLKQETEQTLKSFVARGRDGYQPNTPIDAAREVFKFQKQSISRAQDQAAETVRISTDAIANSSKNIGVMQQRLKRSNQSKTV